MVLEEDGLRWSQCIWYHGSYHGREHDAGCGCLMRCGLSWLTLHCSKPWACRSRKLCSDQAFMCILELALLPLTSESVARWEAACHPLELRVGWHHVTARLQALACEHAPASALLHLTETRLEACQQPRRLLAYPPRPLRAALRCQIGNCSRPFARLPAISRAAHQHGPRVLLRHVSDHRFPTEDRHCDVCYPAISTCIIIFGVRSLRLDCELQTQRESLVTYYPAATPANHDASVAFPKPS
jgi:hypothetical protein